MKVQLEIHRQGLEHICQHTGFHCMRFLYCSHQLTGSFLYYTWMPKGRDHILSSLCKKAHYMSLTAIYSLYFHASRAFPSFLFVSLRVQTESLPSFRLHIGPPCVIHFLNHSFTFGLPGKKGFVVSVA